MQESWAWEPAARPTFTSIADRMARLIPPPATSGNVAASPPIESQGSKSAAMSITSRRGVSSAENSLLFHFAGRYTAWCGMSPLDRSPSKTFLESPVLSIDLSKATTISAWTRRGSIVPRTSPPTQPRFMFSLEAESDNGRSIVAVGLEGGKHEPAVLAWLWPRYRDTGYTVLTSKSAMPARAEPRAEWVRTMWVHIAVVWDARMARLYMNGELHDSAQIVTFESRPKVRLIIGRGLHGGKAAYYWDGLVENLKVSQSAWSSSEIAREMADTKPSLQGSGFSVQPYEDPY